MRYVDRFLNNIHIKYYFEFDKTVFQTNDRMYFEERNIG